MLNSNFKIFNKYVKVNVDGMKTRGEIMDYLMINLFKAYQVVSDTKFLRCIKSKKDQYSDGDNKLAGQLIKLALKKYKISTNSEKFNSMYP